MEPVAESMVCGLGQPLEDPALSGMGREEFQIGVQAPLDFTFWYKTLKSPRILHSNLAALWFSRKIVLSKWRSPLY